MAYNETEIRTLLERYFEGGTSLEEERTLKEYFAGGDVPEDLGYARAIFGFFREASEETHAVRHGRPQPGPGTVRRQAKPRRRRAVIWGAAAAMTAAVAVSVSLATLGRDEGQTVYCYVNGEPITDYELAYAYTQGAFGMITENLQKPKEYMMPLAEVGNALEKLRNLGILNKK